MTIYSLAAIIQSQEQQFQHELQLCCNAMVRNGVALKAQLPMILQDIAHESTCRTLALFTKTRLEGWEEITTSIQQMCQRLEKFAHDYYDKASFEPLHMQSLSIPVDTYSQGYTSFSNLDAMFDNDNLKSSRGCHRLSNNHYTD